MNISNEQFLLYRGSTNQITKCQEPKKSGYKAEGKYIVDNNEYTHRVSLKLGLNDDGSGKKGEHLLAILMNPSQAGTRKFDSSLIDSDPWINASKTDGYRNTDSTITRLFSKLNNGTYQDALIVNTNTHIETYSDMLGKRLDECYCTDSSDIMKEVKCSIAQYVNGFADNSFDLLIATGKFKNSDADSKRMKSYFEILNYLDKCIKKEYRVKYTKLRYSKTSETANTIAVGQSISFGTTKFQDGELKPEAHGTWSLHDKANC